jgi:ribosomal protein S18 acetylase RimI-like enzyme
MNKQTECKKMFTPARELDTPPNIDYRCAVADDALTLYHLDQICFGRLAWPYDAWLEVVAEPDWMTMVLCHGIDIVASSVILPKLPMTHLASIGVAPEFRRRGLGKFLLHNAIHRARGWGAQWLVLEVDVDNFIARHCYRDEGFIVARRFTEDGRQRVEMWRRLKRSLKCESRSPHLL